MSIKFLKLLPVLISGFIFTFAFMGNFVVGSVRAQDETPSGPVYIVEAGDSLWSIAQKFRVSMDDLASLNGIADPNQLTQGTELIIPGLEGITGVLTATNVPFGESLTSLSRKYQIPIDVIAKLNHLTSPMELYAGSTLVLPQNENSKLKNGRALIHSNQTLLELAVLNQQNPWRIMVDNEIESSWQVIPGDILLLTTSGNGGPQALPEMISEVQISPESPLQGKTMIVRIFSKEDIQLSGSFMDHELHFIKSAEGEYIALQGIYALAEVGIYPLSIQIEQNDTPIFSFSQMVDIAKVDYPYDRPLTVDPTTIDPTITGPENEQWFSLVAPVTTEKMWNGTFFMPGPLPLKYCLETGDCWSSRFGNRRSYNGSTYSYFHTGLDIFGGSGTEIYAPAAGVVVFTGSLTIRGNATLIDHGWGVYTGYMHQSEILVKVGDHVEAGQLIGLVGETGRVEGAHLHWEVLVGSVQVDPLDWLSQVYP
jgi:murein DD-endopeptidase MepM/ murein hydrolase activator NlpD